MLSRRCRIEGFSLLEMMVASAIGLFVLAGLLSLFITLSKSDRTTLQRAFLSQQVLAMMDIALRDIRRSGYWHNAKQALLTGTHNLYSEIRIPDPGCVLYSYDKEKTGETGRPRATDHAGFKLKNGTIYYKSKDGTCRGKTCQSCNSGTWWALTDNHALTIDELIFEITRMPTLTQFPQPARSRYITIRIQAHLTGDASLSVSLQGGTSIPNTVTGPSAGPG